ncbi:MAG: type II toxin-antitoxin system prevent-host-death family antitoxin [Planctomycetes bacterium]|nr:type II toxin-antitoxin system prevent-host-death family antitoxin [Planctomycetota bacterium]
MIRRKTRTAQNEVSVRELKARLSEYLRAAREGLEVTVTSHGQPIARLVPAEGEGRGLRVREPLVREPLGAVPRPRLKKRVSAAALRRILDAERKD